MRPPNWQCNIITNTKHTIAPLPTLLTPTMPHPLTHLLQPPPHTYTKQNTAPLPALFAPWQRYTTNLTPNITPVLTPNIMAYASWP